MPIAMIVHGGAWAIPDDQVDAHRAGCRAALSAGWELLASGGSAIDACEVAVRLMEDNPIFDAGVGSVLTSAGTVELDAALMDGFSLRYGSVANVRRVRNPISLAHAILQGPATMLVGEGAEQFAQTAGVPLCDNAELIVERERLIWEQHKVKSIGGPEITATASASLPVLPAPLPATGHDTVGAIALDLKGNLAAANSTGGTPFKLPGRIGDTPLIGCGLYADALVGACVCTGWGESITRMSLARRTVELLERGYAPQSAAELAVRMLAHRVTGGSGGCIVLTPRGNVGLAWNTRRMAYAYRVSGSEIAEGV